LNKVVLHSHVLGCRAHLRWHLLLLDWLRLWGVLR
jgi:hypothetical protein